MVCSIETYRSNCALLGLDLDWPEEPCSRSATSTSHIDWPENGNVLVAGLQTGSEIPALLDCRNAEQKLFVIEADAKLWTIAASDEAAIQWPIGTDIFLFKDFDQLSNFFEINNDLMPPTVVLTFKANTTVSPQMLAGLHDRWAQKLSALKSSYVHFLKSHTGRRSFACLFPQSTTDKLIVEMSAQAIEASGYSFHTYGSGKYPPRQITPYWLLERLLKDEITDFVSINKSRQELYPLIPLECRFIILATEAIPELFEPGAHPVISEKDNIWPLNKFVSEIAEARYPQHSINLQSMPACIAKENFWEERKFELLHLGDAPRFILEKQLRDHPQLGGLFNYFMEVLNKAPAYLTPADLDLLFSLCEKKTNCEITQQEQRNWLLKLIRVQIVGAHNIRKTLIDLVRHQPNIPLKIVGKGWEVEEELCRYVDTNAISSPLSILSNTKIVILGEGLAEKLPSPEMIAAMSQGCVVVAAMNPDDAEPFDLKAIVRVGTLQELEETCLRLIANSDEAKVVAKLGKATIEFNNTTFDSF